MPLSFSILYPLFYLATGLAIGRTPLDIKARASALLTKIVIPFVIVYNIATARADVFMVIGWMAITMSAMLLISRFATKDPVRNLCFCYLNIGWLGLPIATSLFGDGAATIIIAAYVGSSLFGNSVGAGLMAGNGDWRTRIKQTLQAPPVWALLIGLAVVPFGASVEPPLRPLYGVAKFLMSFLGMAILGIWLSQAALRARDIRDALWPAAARAVAMLASVTALVVFAHQRGLTLIEDNQAALYLLAMLPPAANIIVLETHYLKTGRSAAMIAAGTCISVVVIAVYATVVLLHR